MNLLYISWADGESECVDVHIDAIRAARLVTVLKIYRQDQGIETDEEAIAEFANHFRQLSLPDFDLVIAHSAGAAIACEWIQSLKCVVFLCPDLTREQLRSLKPCHERVHIVIAIRDNVVRLDLSDLKDFSVTTVDDTHGLKDSAATITAAVTQALKSVR